MPTEPDPLKAITKNRARYRAATTSLTEELAKLVRDAFDAGYNGPTIAAAAGLSKERIYQLRDGRR